VTGVRLQAYTNRVRAVPGFRLRAVRDTRLAGFLGASIVVAAVVALAVPARAQTFEDLRRGQQAFEAQDYAAAIQRLEPLVGGPTPLVDGPVRLEARKYLAASYVFSNRVADAEAQFALLLADDPNHAVDPIVFSREVAIVFRRVRDRVAAQRARQEAEARAREAERRRVEAERILRERDRIARLEELAREMIVEDENSRVIATVPFGVGQFQNDDEALGWFFLVTEGVFAAASVTTAILYGIAIAQIEQIANEHRVPDDPAFAAANELEDVSRVLNIISFAAFGASAIAGIIEAHASYVPVRREVRERELPDDLDAAPEDPESLELDPMQPPAPSRPKLSVSISPIGTPFGLALRF
jgi:hypothetical protein